MHTGLLPGVVDVIDGLDVFVGSGNWLMTQSPDVGTDALRGGAGDGCHVGVGELGHLDAAAAEGREAASMGQAFRIGEAAKALGVTPKTLRFYEAKGILPPAWRNGAGYRLYAPEDLERARLVLRLKAMGLQLDEAREVLACAEEACCGGTGPQLEATLRSKLAAVEVHIRELTTLRTQLKEALASVRAAVERNRRAGECDEETSLPLE